MHDEKRDNRMHLPPRPLTDHPPRHVGEYPAARDPPGHEAVEREGGGDGGSLEVGRLARGVLGEGSGGDVEAGEADEAAEDEDGEEEGVEGGAEAEGCCYCCGGDAKGYLGK